MEKARSRILLSSPHMGGGEMKFIEKAFAENWVAPLGPNVENFEKEMVLYLGEKDIYAVAMVSGTAAIHVALRLLGVRAGEEILCSSLTFIASANPILYEKCRPIFIDSERETWNICPNSLLKAIEAKKSQGKIPRFLICTDLFGMSANYEAISEICDLHGIEIIEDAAEALGSEYKGRKCGALGRMGVLSFNGNKIITTSGGGMLLTRTREEADKALFLITQARDKAPYYLHSELGYNYRMSNVSAGIGLGQMQVLPERVQARRKNFDKYRERLTGLPLQLAPETDGYFSNRWLSTALLSGKGRETPTELIAHLGALNVETRHVWKPLHTQPIFKDAEFFGVENRAVSEDLFERGICLPSGSSLTAEEFDFVSSGIVDFFKDI